jgi:hypothetical protein
MDTEKINKSCSDVFLIDESLCLSDSLGVIDTNFTNLSTQIINLEKYYNTFQNFYSFFEKNSSNYFNTLTYLKQFSANWDSAFDMVMRNKDKWSSSPIFLVYPNLIEFNDWYLYNPNVRDNIVHWLELYFPNIEYAENQLIKISLNLTKAETFNFNFKKSYDENCSVYNSNTMRCEKCNNTTAKSCCTSNEPCVSKIKTEYVNTLESSNNIKNSVKSNTFDLNFLNQNFNIEYGAILKKNFIINGVGKIGDTNVQSTVLNSELKINASIDRINKFLYLNYDIKSLDSKTIIKDISVKKAISSIRSTVTIEKYAEGNTLSEKSLNVFNNNPVPFGNISAGKYRIKYTGGAMSWNDNKAGDMFCAVPQFTINKNTGTIKTTQLSYGSASAVVNAATNYYGSGNAWFVEFDHNGGAINMTFSDSNYSDNRILNGKAPTFKLIKLDPVYKTTNSNDGVYDMVTLTNPFNNDAEFTFSGSVDNQLYLNDVAVTDFFDVKTKVEKKLTGVVPANGTVKISVYTSQKNNLAADYAEVQGVGIWYSLNDINSKIGFEGNIEWYAKCNPEIKPDSINGCDACNNCDVLPDVKNVTVECGKLSGNKTININYNKSISDRAIYRTLYTSFINKNNKWLFTT